MISVIPVILAIGLYLVTDFVKTYLIVNGKQDVWDKYSPLIPKVNALIGFAVGIIISMVYQGDVLQVLNVLGFNTVGGLASVGIDKLLQTNAEREDKEDKVIFNAIDLKDKQE